MSVPVKKPVIVIIKMTDLEYHNRPEIHFSCYNTPIGKILVSSTCKGVCSIEFADDMDFAFHSLKSRFPDAVIKEQKDEIQKSVLSVFGMESPYLYTTVYSLDETMYHGPCKSVYPDQEKIILHIRGTEFQHRVWKALLSIPFGQLATYDDIAQSVGKPGACRAVGTAVGKNPASFVIPCHRVIRKDGHIGGYYWGREKKQKILEWEKSRMSDR